MKYFIGILFIVSIIVSPFYKQAIFNNKDFQDKYNIKLDIKNDYNHFFFLRDHDPLYVFKKDFIKNYSIYAYKNSKPNLIYPNQETIADMNYISNIQYIGNIREPFKAKFLYDEIDNITNISPFWTHIYNLGQILLPASRHYEGNINKKQTWENTVKLGEKGIFFNCSKQKIQNILSLSDKEYMEIAYSKSGKFYEENENPCTDKQIPGDLGFNYFQYIKNLDKSVKYYKIAGFDETALPGIIGMVGVVNGMLGEHEKSMYILIQKAISMYNVISKNTKLNDKQLKNYKGQITSSIKRAQEELNFYIIEQAEKKAKNCIKDYNCLVKNGYIKQQIQTLRNECIKDIDLRSIKSIKDIITTNTKGSLKNAKCFLLGLGETSGYVSNGQLKSAILTGGTYYYDKDNQRWWVGIRIKN